VGAGKKGGSRLIGAVTALIVVIAVGAVLWFALSGNTPNNGGGIVPKNTAYPVGVVSSASPSGVAPPGVNALKGYTRTYVHSFTGSTLPAGWYRFTGKPGGDPGAQFAGSHVVVQGGLLELKTYKDAAFHNEVVTGGLCQCGLAQKYGAYFVRSRDTGPGPNDAELLWPKVGWPPEVDFNENGGDASGTSATLHFTTSNQIDQKFLTINTLQWHTWGVIWTPTAVTLVVDGREWAKYTRTSEIPQVTMTLDIEQRTACSRHFECPSAPESMLVNWVAEYTPK
jgi:hypothetical protein